MTVREQGILKEKLATAETLICQLLVIVALHTDEGTVNLSDAYPGVDTTLKKIYWALRETEWIPNQ